MRPGGNGFAVSLALAVVLCAPAASRAGGLSGDQAPTETPCDAGDVFIGATLEWAADDGDGFFGCGPGAPLPVCTLLLPDDFNCDLDAVTFDVTQHHEIPPPISLSLDDGDAGPIGPPQTNVFELFNVLPPASPTGMLKESALGLTLDPGAESNDDDVDGYETNMTSLDVPHVGYFFDFSTDMDNPCGLDPGDIYFANCPGYSLFCDDATEIFSGIDDCDIDALHNIQPMLPFPSGESNPNIGSLGWGYLFSIDAASGPNCLAAFDPSDVYYTECSKGLFPGLALWADDVVDLGMTGCDDAGAGTQNSPNYCDIDAISVDEIPTLSEWGIILMSMLMFAGVIVLRRRRSAL